MDYADFLPRQMEAIRRSLDEALSLLVDPHRLYIEAPEGINLMLVQAVCEKIWILDTGVVGLELTAPYMELLTVEARLTLEAGAMKRPTTGRKTERG